MFLMDLSEYNRETKPSQTLVSAKRTKTERSGLHSWHPYYAGYSEKFVDSAIDFLKLDARSVLLDPWGGSGTTSVVASRRGLRSINTEINPVMSTFASAKSPSVLRVRDQIEAFFKHLQPSSRAKGRLWVPCESLESVMSAETAEMVRNLVSQIPIDSTAASSPPDHRRPPLPSFLLAVFFVSLRQLGASRTLANPTWLKASHEKVSAGPIEFVQLLQHTAAAMLGDLESFYGNSVHAADYETIECDVKSLPLTSASVDAVITSPPYLTRIDYAVSTMPEMMFFGDLRRLDAVRHETMGAPVIKRIDRVQRPVWGERCNSLLNAIASHDSKAAKSYYWKNIIQYFMDMEAGLLEIGRVLKYGGSGLIVVQSSYFKEHEIELGEIYVEMCLGLGLHAEIAFREDVKTHMAHVNTKSSKYVKNKIYHEDFVYIEKIPKA